MDYITCKYSDWKRSEDEALLNILGGEVIARKLLSGDLKFIVSEDVAKIILAIKKLFDKNGRKIPRNLENAVCDASKNSYVIQPDTIYYDERIKKGINDNGLNAFMCALDFLAYSDKLITKIKADEQLRNLLNGVYLPIIIPKTNLTDLGEMTGELMVNAGKSYLKEFPGRSFDNRLKRNLKGQVTIVEGSRYDVLVEKIKQESVIGIFFPAVLQGYSVLASIEQMSDLPENVILSGPLDIAMALAMYPDVLGRDENALVYDFSAVNWELSDYSLSLRPTNETIAFGRWADLAITDESCSSGLLVI